MKKLILILVAATITLTGFAAGTGDGLSKANAIEFNWEEGNTQEAGTYWYKVTFGTRLDIASPNLALYLTNLSSSDDEISVSAFYAGDEESRTYKILGNGMKVWNTSATMIKNMVKDDEGLFVKLTTHQKFHLSAKVFEGTFADDACLKATAYDVAPHSLKAGTNWYTVNVGELRANRQGLKITYAANNGTSKIVSMISTDCPSTGLAGLKGSIPNKKAKVHEISPVLIQNMSESTVFLKVENSKQISVTTEVLTMPADPIDFSNPVDVAWNTEYDLTTAGQAYRVKLTDLIPQQETENDGKKYLEPQITFNNENNAAATPVKVEIAFKNESDDNYKTDMVITKHDTIVANEVGFMDFARNLLESLDATNCAYVYIRITPVQNIKVSARLKHMREGNACGHAQAVKWDETIYQNVEVDDETSTQWYAIDITPLKDETNPQDVTVTITNNGTATAQVTADVAFVCSYIDLQSVTRQVEVGKPISKTIKYSSIATLGSNTIYVGVTTTQAVTIKAVPSKAETKPEAEVTCDKAEEYKPVDFDLEKGHKQAKDVIVWYKVKAGDIQKAFSTDIPEIVITNEGDQKLTVTGELSKNCPDIYENQTRTLTIGANEVYKKEIAKDLFVKYDEKDVFYIKLTGNQPFNFRLNKKIENEGASCLKAIPFNWTTGHNQDANTTLWYAIDLKDSVKNTSNKRVRVIIKNLSGKDATIDGVFAPKCPTTSPQSQTIELKGNQVRQKDIARSTFLTFDDVVYVRLSGSQKFHFEAKLVDAPAYSENICDQVATMTAVEVNKTETDNYVYARTSDATWYKIETAQLKDSERAPRITVINGDAAQAITAYIAYECNITEEMMSMTRSFAANQTMSKTLEQDIVDQLAKYNEVYVKVEGTKNYEFRVDMVEPTGEDCLHAVEIKKDVVRHQEAGKTKWYKLHVGDLKDNEPDKKLVFSLTNTDGKAGNVHAVAFTDCEGKEIISGNATIGANGKREKAIMVEALSSLNTEWVYLQLTAAQAQDILMQIVDRNDLEGGPFEACETGTMPFAVNTDYNQNAAETVWYRVNIKAIRENTTGDATLIVTDLSGEDNTVSAEIAWVCPVTKEMTGKTMVLKGNDVYTRIFGREMLNSAEGKDEAYIRVISEKPMKFRVNMNLSKGAECTDKIEFDWANGNTNPQGACLWYNVALIDSVMVDDKKVAELKIPEGKDLELMIVNLSNEKAYASADIRFECREQSLGDKQYTFAPKDTVRKIIDRDLVVNMGSPTSVLINLCTPNSAMFIKATFVNELKRDTLVKDTIVYWCDSAELIDGYTQVGFESRHYPYSGDASSLTWGDTLHVRVGTMLVDSVYSFKVIPLMAAEAFGQERYDALTSDTIVAEVNKAFTYADFAKYLETYYTDLTKDEKLADFDRIDDWEIFDANQGDWDVADNVIKTDSVLTEETTNIQLAYKAYTGCVDNGVRGVIFDTIRISVINPKTKPECEEVQLPTIDTKTWPQAFCGQPYDVKTVEKQIKDAGVNEDITLYIKVGDKAYEAYNGTNVMNKGDKVSIFAQATNSCGNTANSDTLDITVVEPDGKADQVTHLPLASEYNGKVLIIDLKTINENWGLNLHQGDENEALVKWYIQGETEPVQNGGYYLTENENMKMKTGKYYAEISIVTGSEDECGGIWRTIIQNVQNPESVGTRKHMINGKLYIITEDNVMFDAQGQKVQ